jgi:hypothetical protein
VDGQNHARVDQGLHDEQGDSAIGAIDSNDAERAMLAEQSHSYRCSECGYPERNGLDPSREAPTSAWPEAAPAPEALPSVPAPPQERDVGPQGVDYRALKPGRTRGWFIMHLDLPVIVLLGLVVMFCLLADRPAAE